MDEIGPEPLRGQTTFQPGTGLTGHKAQSHALTAQLPEHAGNIDALAAQHAVLPGGAVHFAHLKRSVETDHIINGRIECNSRSYLGLLYQSVLPVFGVGAPVRQDGTAVQITDDGGVDLREFGVVHQEPRFPRPVESRSLDGGLLGIWG